MVLTGIVIVAVVVTGGIGFALRRALPEAPYAAAASTEALPDVGRH